MIFLRSVLTVAGFRYRIRHLIKPGIRNAFSISREPHLGNSIRNKIQEELYKMPTETTMIADIQVVLKKYTADRDNLIPILQEVQEMSGYISEESMDVIADYLDITPTEIYGVATFYTQFVFTRPGEHVIKVCLGTACHVKKGQQIMGEIINYLGIQPGETTEDYKFTLAAVACLGSCALAPAVVIDGEVYGRQTPQSVKKLLKEIRES